MLKVTHSDDCNARLVRFRPCKTRSIRITGFSFSFSKKNENSVFTDKKSVSGDTIIAVY